MGRADKDRYNNQESQQLNQNNALLQQAINDRTGARSTLMPQLQDILAHPGYSDSDKQAMLNATTESIGGSFGDAQQQLADRAARTGNSAGLIPAEEELGRQKARMMSQAALGLTKGFADTAMQQRALALSGLSGLYRDAAPVIGATLGSNTSLIGDQARLAGIPGIGTQLANTAISTLPALAGL